MVKQWVDDIMKNNEMVKKKLWEHASSGSPLRYSNLGHLQNPLKDRIMNVVGAEANEAGELVTSEIQKPGIDSITTNLNAVKSGIDHFSTKLGMKLTTDRSGALIQEIIQPLSQPSGLLPRTTTSNPASLTCAVEAALAALHATAKRNVDDISTIITQYYLGNVHDAIRNVNKINKHIDGQGDEADDYGKKIDDALRKVQQPLNSLHSQLNEATGHPAGSSGKPNHAKNLDEAIEAVKNKAVELTTGDTTAMATLSDQIKSNLVALTGEFAIAGKKVIEQLEKLKREISLNKDGEGLHKIHKQLKELHGVAVTEALSAAEKFLKPDAYKLRDETIEKLRGQVDKEIENAKKLMIKQAQKIYVTSVKEMLKAFADKVQKELQDLPKQIDKERKEGFKGFMRTVEGKITDNATTDENIKKLKDLASESADTAEQKATLFKTLSTKFKEFFGPLKGYLDTEIMRLYKDSNAKKNPPVTIGDKDPHPYADALDAVQSKLNTLLDELHNSNHFTHSLTINLGNLSTALNSLVPTNFEGPCNTLPDVLKVGLRGFHAELEKAYVSVYDGVNFGASLTETKVHADGRTSGKLTTYGTKCAKVFLTLLSILSDDLNALKTICKGTCKFEKISKSTTLGEFLADNGFIVCKTDNQDGELRGNEKFRGQHIHTKLNENIDGAERNPHLPKCKEHEESEEITQAPAKIQFNVTDILECLVRHLHQYNRVSHLIVHPKPKHPSSIYDMLTWLSGLTYNAVNNDLALNGFPQLFDKPKIPASEDSNSAEPVVLVEDDDALEAYPKRITATGLSDTLAAVCHKSHAVLTAILGHGHSGGIYACDFNTNPQGFLYPAHFNALVCMLFECLKRVHHQLYLLYQQCKHTSKLSGWSDCHYGRNVGGSSWNCNTNQCADLDCPQKADQSANQNGNQRANQSTNQACKQHPNCGLKSPLQSFLEDGLQGFLPHSVTVRGTGLTCSTCSKGSPGIPCRTPMGFSEISLTASHTKTGAHICDVLYKFCHSVHSPLTKLCSQLNCVLPSAPKTLDQMFAFYYHLLSDPFKNTAHRTDAFNKAVIAANFDNSSTTLDVSSLVGSSNHSENHLTGGLNTLVKCQDNGGSPVHPCGSYLKPLCDGIYGAVSKDHAAKYLSWVLYITGTFYDLLKSLYEECCSNCTKPGTTCNGRGCHKECMVKGGFLYAKSTPSHWSECKSIVNCKMTLPTLCKYGMYFASKSHLNGERDGTGKRTCEDFCSTLEKVVKEGNVLYTLVHKLIPDFLFKIREPFIWTLLALWSLSLLYLLHITVVRLDVLRIRSHLRSPSSHRIAAQSLLAAARVKALANVKYFSP
ncbi:hypothetical protein, conserved [Babesia ovata]|uniref:C3H1-type domain-containing protein n=1 Tax=Babesia ovata TaxID=189622 RepID=A0A2H6KJS0_9APIC|nr:uncharacterized protein BOVATA_047380 [Babesia ovata]GBE63245.1 hypothetical protein, conserved [Babesia ovata]